MLLRLTPGLVLLTLSVATTLGWSNAQAQEAANQSVLEEIVVTAEFVKRAQDFYRARRRIEPAVFRR